MPELFYKNLPESLYIGLEIDRYIGRFLGFTDIGISSCWQNAVIFLKHPDNLRKKARAWSGNNGCHVSQEDVCKLWVALFIPYFYWRVWQNKVSWVVLIQALLTTRAHGLYILFVFQIPPKLKWMFCSTTRWALHWWIERNWHDFWSCCWSPGYSDMSSVQWETSGLT